MRSRLSMLTLALALAAAACGPSLPETPGRFGEVTSAVVIVNPVINAGSTTLVPTGPARDGVWLHAADLPAVTTDDGLALVQDLPTGLVPITFDNGSVDVSVVLEKELYDVVVAYTASGVQHIIQPVRYPLGSSITVVPAGADINALATNGAILLLEAGLFPGPVELRTDNVLVFGAWDPEQGPLSTIDGNVTVLGGFNRLRGVNIAGTLQSNANNLSVAFSDIAAANITGNGVSLLRNRFTAGFGGGPELERGARRQHRDPLIA